MNISKRKIFSAAALGGLFAAVFAGRKADAQGIIPSISNLYPSTLTAINVKNQAYGATGNGTTDDTIAINLAKTAALAGSGALYFPAGKYLVSDYGIISGGAATGQAIAIPSLSNPLTIFGDGPGQSQIFLSGSSTAAPNGTSIIVANSQVTITDLNINGNIAGRYTYYSTTESLAGAAVFFSSGSDNSRISNCTVSAPGFQAIAVAGPNSPYMQNISILNNIVYAGYDTGIDIDGSVSNYTVSGNIIYCMTVFQTGGTASYNFTKYAIALDYNSTQLITAQGSVINNSIFVYSPATSALGGAGAPTGILIQGCQQTLVTANNIQCSGGNGITLVNDATQNIVIANSIILNPSASTYDNGFGIDLQAGAARGYGTIADKATNTVSYNTIVTMLATTVYAGLHAYNTGATFISNTVRGFAGSGNASGILIDDSTNATTAFTYKIFKNVSDSNTVAINIKGETGGALTFYFQANEFYNSGYDNIQVNGVTQPSATALPSYIMFHTGDLVTTQAAAGGPVTANGATAVTVANSAVTAASIIDFQSLVPSATPGIPYVTSRTAGTSFAFKVSNTDTTSTWNYTIRDPA